MADVLSPGGGLPRVPVVPPVAQLVRPSEARRPPPAGELVAPPRRAAGVGPDKAGAPRDHLWEVLHRREQSSSPRNRRPESPAGPRQSRSAPSRPEEAAAANAAIAATEAPPVPPAGRRPRPFVAAAHEVVEGGRGSLGDVPAVRAIPHAGSGGEAGFVEIVSDWRNDLKAGGLLKPRIVGVDALPTDAMGWLERRLESAQAEQRAELSRRWGVFEQGDRRFKEWVQREHEQLQGNLQQVKVATIDGQQQQMKQASALAAQYQKFETKVFELEAAVAQAQAHAQGIAQTVQTIQSGAGFAGASGAPFQAALESLRNDLQRESAARVDLSQESTEKIKELHGLIAQLNSRQEHDALSRQQQLADQASQRQARFAEGERGVESLRVELETLRDQFRRTSSDTARRCEEVEMTCNQRVAGVQEAALNAARELWEEHQGVVVECKASLASLQQILEAKDKIAAQLQSLQQQQRDDDKHELLTRLQQGQEALLRRASDVEASVSAEQAARLEAQQAAEMHAGRLGVALEKAQGAWVKESERFASELRELRQALDRSVDGEARGWERRLAEAVDTTHRRLDDLDSRSNVVKAALSAAEDRISDMVRSSEAELKGTEGHMKRQLADLQTMLAGRISQCDFELRAVLRTSLIEQAERLRAELAQVEQGAAAERAFIRGAADDKAKEVEERQSKLRDEMDRRLASAEDTAARRQTQAAEACSALRADLVEYHREARAYADRLTQDARAAIAVAASDVHEELTRQGQRHERQCADLVRETASLEDRLSSSIASLDAKTNSRFSEELGLERERTREEMQRLLEEERSTRVRTETERLGSLQKRLGAHEELTTRRLDELRGRQDDAMATHRQQIEAKLLQERQDARQQIEMACREFKEADTNAKADLARLDERCKRLEEELPEVAGRLGERLEERCRDLRQVLDTELAAFSAKLAVSLATFGTDLRQGLGAVDSKFEESLSCLRRRLDDLVASITAQTTDLEGRLNRLGEANDGVLGQMEEQSSQVSQALQGLQEHVEGTVSVAREAMQSESGQLAERLRELQDSLHGVEEEVLKRLRDLEDVQERQGLHEDGLLGSLQDQLGELASRLEVQQSSAAEALTEAKASAAAALQEASASSASALQAAREDSEATVAALEEKLLADIYDGEERRINLSTRLDDLEEDIRKEEGRAQAAEDGLKQALEQQREDLQMQLQEAEKAHKQHTNDAVDRLNTQFETLRGEQDTSLHALEAHMHEAESGVRRSLQEHQEAITGKLQELATQQEKRSGDVASDLGARIEELRAEQKNAREDAASQLSELRDEQRSSVEAEGARAKEAEAELVRLMDRQRCEDREVIKSVEERSGTAEAELRRRLDEVNKAQESQRAAQEERLQQFGEQQQKQAENGASDLKVQFEAWKQEQSEALRKEEARAHVAEKDLAQRLDSQEKDLQSSKAELQAAIDEARAAQQEAATQSAGSLSSKIEALRSEHEQVTTAIRAQVQAAEIAREEAHIAFQAQVQKATESGAKASQEQVQQQTSAIEDLTRRLDAAERHGDDIAKETRDLQELHGQWTAEQAKINKEVETRQDASGDDIELLGQKLQELAAQTETSADAQELQQKAQSDIAQLQEKLAGIDQEVLAKSSGLEDQMGALVQTAADLMSKVDSCASKEALIHLTARLDGSFDALVVRFETERWVREGCDRVADNVANQFLRLLDEASSKIEHRMEDCEKRLATLAG